MKDILRERVQREVEILLLKQRWTSWELAKRIAAARSVNAPRRANGQKISAKAIDNLRNGKNCHENTIFQIAEFIAQASPFGMNIFFVDENLVECAKSYMSIMKRRHTDPGTMKSFSGCYSLASEDNRSILCDLLLDYVPEHNVHLMRAVLSFSYSFEYQRFFFDGFAIPTNGQLQLHMRNLENGVTIAMQFRAIDNRLREPKKWSHLNFSEEAGLGTIDFDSDVAFEKLVRFEKWLFKNWSKGRRPDREMMARDKPNDTGVVIYKNHNYDEKYLDLFDKGYNI
ncbi:hypothetical protein [Roseitalea porphyridii]|uniref:Uncharacterized protein n=1 Tax=Roseitalea porphyridii TaxID=1852022 RepID=A0A4P6UZ68_9HYPH|nr:hypothetical protein [Roseitalea porphyridii]QBK29793.1 hypothetical protein E0E05_03765 [Roseitalea porphyridii]